MSDAPETIYAKHLGLDDASWWVVPVSGATEYRRADLAPTTAQIMAHPKVQALVGAAHGLQQFFAMPDECRIGRFDRLSEQYRRETGKWAPGKSIPDAYNDSTDCETLRKDYDDWVKSKVVTARAALAALEEKTDV